MNALKLIDGPFDGVVHELPCPFGMVMTPAAFSLIKDGVKYQYKTDDDKETATYTGIDNTVHRLTKYQKK